MKENLNKTYKELKLEVLKELVEKEKKDGKIAQVDLSLKFRIEFTENYGFFKKGDKATVGNLEQIIYTNKLKVAKEIIETKGQFL